MENVLPFGIINMVCFYKSIPHVNCIQIYLQTITSQLLQKVPQK